MGVASLKIFGIGSLVNSGSIAVPVRSIEAAQTTGWRRAWNQRFPMRQQIWSTLGIEPADPGEPPMLGALLSFDASDEGYFREREAGYDWVEVEAQTADGETTTAWTFAPARLPTERHAIPLSYALTVLIGFDAVHTDGARQFIENTSGWDMGVIDDSADPLYPRHPEPISPAREKYLPLVERFIG